MSASEDSQAERQREIEDLEQQEAKALLRADTSALRTLWADDLLVNSTANLIAGKAILLEMIESGKLRLQSLERRTVRLAMDSDLVVATGNEASQLAAAASRYRFFGSYMNVWRKRQGAWQLIARHVGVIERKET
jgi:ketosteroid isomerase-like protein